MIFKFLEFIKEVKSSKLQYFKQPEISNLFTAAIEIEMETNSSEDVYSEYTEQEVDEIVNLIKKSVIKELNRTKNFQTSGYIKFIDNIFSEMSEAYDDDEYMEDMLNPRNYKNKDEKLIVKIIYPQWITYFMADNFTELKNEFKSNLPNFFEKWGNQFKYEVDNTLTHGLEISNSSYFDNINTLFECIEDFYTDFNNQNYWIFNDKTGIHINLGFKEEKGFNIIRGLLFLDDFGDNPFVFKNMEWRKSSKFTGSVLERLTEYKTLLKRCLRKLELNQISEVENIINEKLVKILYDEGYKNFGVNLLNLESNYVEFRYPGGQVNEETLKDKVLYFCYIIYMMTNENFDKKEYQKKLYKFLSKNISD